MSQGSSGSSKRTRAPLTLVAQPGKRGAPLSGQSVPQVAEAETQAANGEKIAAKTEKSEAADAQQGILYTANDVRQLIEECNTLLTAIGQRGAVVDQKRLRSAAESFAAIRLLILKGLCTEDEAQGEVYAAMRGILAGTLQEVEEARLKAQAQQRGPVAVQRPTKLLVAKH